MKQLAVPKLDTRKLPALSKLKMNEVGYSTLYLQARKALEECVRVDEIKDIADKHSAIAHYAKQIKDDSLLQYAKRIKLRAYECMGALLKEIPDGKKRSEIAKENHLSGATFSQAIRMQELPPRVRDKLIDQKIPSSLLDIARYADEHAGRPAYGFSHYAIKEGKMTKSCQSQSEKVYSLMVTFILDLERCTYNDKHEETYTPSSLGFALPTIDKPGAKRLIKEVYKFLDGYESKL